MSGRGTPCTGPNYLGENQCAGDCRARTCALECVDTCGEPLKGFNGNGNRVHRVCCLDDCGAPRLDTCGRPFLDA
eukprot:3934940-Rhodomonas_salina.2